MGSRELSHAMFEKIQLKVEIERQTVYGNQMV